MVTKMTFLSNLTVIVRIVTLLLMHKASFIKLKRSDPMSVSTPKKNNFCIFFFLYDFNFNPIQFDPP